MNLWVVHVVQQHDGGDWHRSVFSDVSSFVKGELNDLQSIKIDELAKIGGSGFGAETRKAMDVLMAIATVSFARHVIEHEDARWELIIES